MIKIYLENDSKQVRYVFDTIFSILGFFYEFVENISQYEDRINIYIVYEKNISKYQNCNIISIYNSSDKIQNIYYTGSISLEFMEEPIPVFYNQYKSLSDIPVVLYQNGNIAVAKADYNSALNIIIGFDFIKTILFFLTRLEEIQNDKNDKLGRFSSSQSIISKYYSHEKPLIDIYLRFFRDIINQFAENSVVTLIRKELWPGGKKFAVCLTHDVDKVYFKTFYGFTFGMIQIIKNLFLFNFKSAKKAYKKCKRIAFAKNDPYWNFKKWVELERQFGYHSTFFFLARKKRLLVKYKDLRYTLNQPKVIKALNYLCKNGWDIGLYGDLDSHLDIDKLKNEKLRLENITEAEIIGIRQHYLRIKLPQSWQVQQNVRFLYDSTLGWHDSIGFRCGMSFPFYPFDIETSERMNLMEIPLAIEEPNLFKPKHNLRSEENATGICKDIFKTAEKLGSLINLLWCQPVLDEIDFPHRGKVYKNLLNYLKKNDVFVGALKDIFEWFKKRDNVKIIDEKICEQGITWELKTDCEIFDLNFEIACKRKYKIRISKDINYTIKKNNIQFEYLKKDQNIIISLLF